MSVEHLAELNKTHSGIPYPEEMGGGIMVEIEVFHQLHCLVLTSSESVGDKPLLLTC